MTIYRLFCSRHRETHEIEQAQHPTLVKILLEPGSGCDGKYYRYTDYDDRVLDKPWVSAFPFPEKPTWRVEEGE